MVFEDIVDYINYDFIENLRMSPIKLINKFFSRFYRSSRRNIECSGEAERFRFRRICRRTSKTGKRDI